MTLTIGIPELSLVLLVGPSGSGKSSFARKHFKPTEVLSSDFCRGLVSDNENDQTATKDAFAVLHFIAAKRLAAGKLTVIDATNVQPESRRPLIQLARDYHCLPVAIVFDLPDKICQERNLSRSDREFGSHVIRQQSQQLRRSFRGLKKEGFRHIYKLDSVEAVDAATVARTPLWNNKKNVPGPFDIIGDVHGCFDELKNLLEELRYQVDKRDSIWHVSHPEGRRIVFVGDLVDRGPRSPEVLRLAMDAVASGSAFCVPGNHDAKLLRKLRGNDVRITHGLAETLQQLEGESPEFIERVKEFIDGLVSHLVFDGGNLVVAHAGMKEEFQGRGSGRVRDFALYGETTGEIDDFGLPVRYPWAEDYRGRAMVVYGHTPVPEAEWLNRTINIDTGCVFGGKLTALRYPEKELVSVPAMHVYYEPTKPFLPEGSAAPAFSAQQQHDHVLDLEDIIGKRIISTAIHHTVTIREENAIAALEVMSRFAANPKWLIYLPPTMSPTETSAEPGLLEHPAEAFAYYRAQGVPHVICQEKHMGSRAIVIVCRDAEVARRRFGVAGDEAGICYTRTGRHFFSDAGMQTAFLQRVRDAMTRSGLWEALDTEWICLDCELMPWSAKAQSLLQQQYAPVGSAALAALTEARSALEALSTRTGEHQDRARQYDSRLTMARQYVAAYRQYCWPVNGIADYRLAPFHILATEGKAHMNTSHAWHLEHIRKLCDADPDWLRYTPHRLVDVTDTASCAAAADWWLELTAKGGEGMVIKPLEFTVKSRRGLVQPGIKCRGREYLRIIYGPEYTAEEHLTRLRSRGIATKRSLAQREYALGHEALHRFVRKEPLYRVHECVFGILALESEPVDPRL